MLLLLGLLGGANSTLYEGERETERDRETEREKICTKIKVTEKVCNQNFYCGFKCYQNPKQNTITGEWHGCHSKNSRNSNGSVIEKF